MGPLTSICAASIITGAIYFADELHKGLLKQQCWKTKKKRQEVIKVSLNCLADVLVASMNTLSVNNLHRQTHTHWNIHTHTYRVRNRETERCCMAKRKSAKRLQGHKHRPTTGSCTYVARCASLLCSPRWKRVLVGVSGISAACARQMQDSKGCR